jgi:hypothetical protein
LPSPPLHRPQATPATSRGDGEGRGGERKDEELLGMGEGMGRVGGEMSNSVNLPPPPRIVANLRFFFIVLKYVLVFFLIDFLFLFISYFVFNFFYFVFN